ncbi:MAG: hypothetical protein AB8G99_04630 [Planctomycetaceae bacterium]
MPRTLGVDVRRLTLAGPAVERLDFDEPDVFAVDEVRFERIAPRVGLSDVDEVLLREEGRVRVTELLPERVLRSFPELREDRIDLLLVPVSLVELFVRAFFRRSEADAPDRVTRCDFEELSR